jgi:hypothetical protein
MQTVSTQKAADLPPGVKAVEQLLGRLIGADKELSVVAVPPRQIPPSENRANRGPKARESPEQARSEGQGHL